MEEQIEKNGSLEFHTKEEIQKHIQNIQDFRVVRYISEETARKWKDGENGKLWVVSLRDGCYAFCLPCGIFVP